MKRILAALGLMAIAVTALWAADMMSVQVTSVPVRSRPSNIGPVLGQLSYGDRIEILADRAGFMQVVAPDGTTGWVHGSALTKKNVVLSSGGTVETGASSDEVALAGKGFNAEIEAEYKAQTDLDFTWVDTMGEWGLTEEELIGFLREGQLEGVAE